MMHRHIDFEVPGFGEVDAGPTVRRGYLSEALADDPLALWRFDQTAGEAALDFVADHHAALAGGVTLGDAGPLAFDEAPAMKFDGVDGHAALPEAGLLSGRSACTVTFWLRLDAASVERDHAIVSSWRSGVDGLLVWIDRTALVGPATRTLSFAVRTGASPSATGRVEGPTDLIRPGAWDFYACVFVGGQHLRLYRGATDLPVTQVGESIGVVGAAPTLTEPLRFAATGSPGAIGYLDGALANLAIYPAALPIERLAAQCNAGVGRWA